MHAISFEPIYQERVWGGRKLASMPNRQLPGDAPIGESWDLVDRPEAQSIVRHPGEFGGACLRDLLKKHSNAVMGPDYDPSRPFPILVKWLDCRERLSLQVHPPRDIAEALGGEPKTENWYIVEADPGAALVVGLKPEVNREAFRKALETETLESCLHRFEVEKGDSIFVPSGRLHAIDAGNLILEIQQNSDTTYRVYDWGRVGLDGNPRQLHVAASLESIEFGDVEPSAIKPGPQSRLLADAEEFRLREQCLAAGEQWISPGGQGPRIINVVNGDLKIDDDPQLYPLGSTLLLPHCQSYRMTAENACTLLVTDRFV